MAILRGGRYTTINLQQAFQNNLLNNIGVLFFLEIILTGM